MAATPQTVLQAVREAIHAEPLFRDVFEPIEEGLHEENGYTFVQVRMNRLEPFRRRIEWYARFAELESHLQADKGMDVVIVPVAEPLAA